MDRQQLLKKLNDSREVEKERRRAAYGGTELAGKQARNLSLYGLVYDSKNLWRGHSLGPRPPFYFDHPAWFIKDGEYRYVTQPYLASVGSSLSEVSQKVSDFAEKHGLLVHVSLEESWHFVGRTVLIEFRKNPARDLRLEKFHEFFKYLQESSTEGVILRRAALIAIYQGWAVDNFADPRATLYLEREADSQLQVTFKNDRRLFAVSPLERCSHG
jgi:hypothetical protein